MSRVLDRVFIQNSNINKFKSKTNYTFAILSAIGIVMVVSAHAGSALNLFSDYFPYNSFFMPMFIFISGYFFKDKNIKSFDSTKNYIIKKIKNLLIYYFIFNVIYGLIRLILFKLNLDNDLIKINFYTLIIQPFIDGQQFGLNAPAWFLPTLFTVEVSFVFVRKIQLYLIKYKNFKRIDIINLLIFLILSIVCIYISEHYTCLKIFVPFLKLGFFLFFFQLGRIYKDRLEVREKEIPTIIVIFVTLLVNIILIKIYKNIEFISLYNMTGFHNINPVIPIITSITGTWFWLRIAREISPVLCKSKIIMDISNNTKGIMMHHIFCMELFNILLYYLKDFCNLTGFNVEKFRSPIGWYRYFADIKQLEIIYVIIGVFGSLIIIKLIKKLKDKLYKAYKTYKTIKMEG